MAIHDMMDLDTFKLIIRSITESENLETMGSRSTQLLVASLGIKASAIFALNPETEEIETLASFGLSIDYLNKGPIKITKSKGWTSDKEPVVINDITITNMLQYPEQTKDEGIMALASIPIIFFNRVIGLLRLYHHQTWNISKEDLDTFTVLAEIIGMAMMYSRILNALQSVKDSVDEVHSIWLQPKSS